MAPVDEVSQVPVCVIVVHFRVRALEALHGEAFDIDFRVNRDFGEAVTVIGEGGEDRGWTKDFQLRVDLKGSAQLGGVEVIGVLVGDEYGVAIAQ
jgi:hypothetical protein